VREYSKAVPGNVTFYGYDVQKNESLGKVTHYRPIIPQVPPHCKGECWVNEALCEFDMTSGNWEVGDHLSDRNLMKLW
jgi:hypothetical protein